LQAEVEDFSRKNADDAYDAAPIREMSARLGHARRFGGLAAVDIIK